MTDRITTEDLTDEQIERVLSSRGFQKMLAYQRLADGIDVLEDEQSDDQPEDSNRSNDE